MSFNLFIELFISSRTYCLKMFVCLPQRCFLVTGGFQWYINKHPPVQIYVPNLIWQMGICADFCNDLCYKPVRYAVLGRTACFLRCVRWWHVGLAVWNDWFFNKLLRSRDKCYQADEKGESQKVVYLVRLDSIEIICYLWYSCYVWSMFLFAKWQHVFPLHFEI